MSDMSHGDGGPERRQARSERVVMGAGLAAMVTAVCMDPGVIGKQGRGLAAGVLLAVASLAWVAWTGLGPHGDRPVVRTANACTAWAGSGLIVLYPSLAVFWFAFWPCVNAGANYSVRWGATVVGGAAAVLLTGYAAGQGTVLAGFAAVCFVGFVVGRNRRTHLDAADRARRSVTERESAATGRERNRIAGELHDVVGHSLTGISLQIESAAAALEVGAPPEAVLGHLDRAGSLVRTGRQEVTEAVRTVREGEVHLDVRLSELTRDQPLRRFHLSGVPRPLPSPVGLALVRVAQEAMTNANRHAPGTVARVVLDFTDTQVALAVANPLPDHAAAAPSDRGFGLAGMRERMRAVGGTLSAGPAEDGTWQVRARVDA